MRGSTPADAHPLGECMYKHEQFKCVKDLHLLNHQVAFTKGKNYHLKKSDGNDRYFTNDLGWEQRVMPTEFGLHFMIKTD